MIVRLNQNAAQRLRARLAEMGFCDVGVGDAIDALSIDDGEELSVVVDAICRGEGFDDPNLVDRRMWRSIRDLVVAASHESAS